MVPPPFTNVIFACACWGKDLAVYKKNKVLLSLDDSVGFLPWIYGNSGILFFKMEKIQFWLL